MKFPSCAMIFLPLIATAASSDPDDILLSFLAESSFGRDRVVDLIVKEYTSSSNPKRIDDAIQAMELSQTDGDPVPVKGHDFLFVGSVGASMNEKSLRENGITHVINWSNTAKCNLFEGIDYLCMSGIRSKNKMIKHMDDLDKAVDYVESVRKSGGKVLSHCWYGRNRSVSLVVAYLVKYEGMTPAEATGIVRATRPQADPWWKAVNYYSEQYLEKGHIAAEQQALEDWEEGTRTRRLRGGHERKEHRKILGDS